MFFVVRETKMLIYKKLLLYRFEDWQKFRIRVYREGIFKLLGAQESIPRNQFRQAV
jgi:hypothetical protein